MDKTSPADWLKVQPKSVITLSDPQGIEDSMKRGKGVKGIDYTVQTVARMDQLQGLSTHLFFTLADAEQAAYLLVKIVDSALDVYIYFAVPGLDGGSRKVLLDRGLFWLFQQPANPNQYDPSELLYSTTLKQTVDKTGGGSMEVLYTLKGQGELQCKYRETPARSGVDSELLATVVEYRADQAVQNPEFLILETGAQRSGESFVQFFLGCAAKLSEVDVLAV